MPMGLGRALCRTASSGGRGGHAQRRALIHGNARRQLAFLQLSFVPFSALSMVWTQEKERILCRSTNIYTYINRTHGGLGDTICVIVCEALVCASKTASYFLASSRPHTPSHQPHAEQSSHCPLSGPLRLTGHLHNALPSNTSSLFNTHTDAPLRLHSL